MSAPPALPDGWFSEYLADESWRERVVSFDVLIDRGDRMLIRHNLRSGFSRLEWVKRVDAPRPPPRVRP